MPSSFSSGTLVGFPLFLLAYGNYWLFSLLSSANHPRRVHPGTWLAEFPFAKSDSGHKPSRAGQLPGNPEIRLFFHPPRNLEMNTIKRNKRQPFSAGRKVL
jgi:hypothetical protein